MDFKHLAPLPPAKWHPVADLPSKHYHEFLYVLLPGGKVTQALYTDFDTGEIEGMTWGHYTDCEGYVDPLPVQPSHFFSPPQPPTT